MARMVNIPFARDPIFLKAQSTHKKHPFMSVWQIKGRQATAGAVPSARIRSQVQYASGVTVVENFLSFSSLPPTRHILPCLHNLFYTNTLQPNFTQALQPEQDH
jgi:hypothetical protein